MRFLIPFLGRSRIRVARLEGGVRRMQEKGWMNGEVVATINSECFLRISREGPTEFAIIGAGVLEGPRSPLDTVDSLVKRVKPLPVLLMADERTFRARDWWELGGTRLWDLILDEETHSSESLAKRLRSATGFATALDNIERLQGAFPERWVALLRRALPFAQKS